MADEGWDALANLGDCGDVTASYWDWREAAKHA